MPPSTSPTDHHRHHQTSTALSSLLDTCRPFLRDELHLISPSLPPLVSVLRSAGAGECWHKHGSFLSHLLSLHKTLHIWGSPPTVSLCGLFHSAYSNSYVNLAIFDPSTTGRDDVRRHIGPAAERLVHLFCVVPRQPLIHDELLFKYSDEDLRRDLAASERDGRRAREGVWDGVEGEGDGWRGKVNSLVGRDGVVVKHIKSGEDVRVSRRVVAVFVMMTMGDFSDQLFGFQDRLFRNDNGRLEFSGNDMATLWPGDGKPGLWMNSISRMGGVYTLLHREEEIFIANRRRTGGVATNTARDEDIELVTPPVFANCTRIVDPQDQIQARDSYWEAVCGGGGGGGEEEERLRRAEELLVRSVEKNPYVGEPYVVLGQVYLVTGRYEEAERVCEEGLRLLLEWGSPWDKRMSWEGWVAWGRVLVMKAKERCWPKDGWGVLNLGLVR